MRRLITRVVLFVILINISTSALWARNADGDISGARPHSWITKAVHAIRGLSSSQDLLRSDEGLETEGGPDMGPDVPVDGGVSLLLAAGAAYGLRRLRAKRK